MVYSLNTYFIFSPQIKTEVTENIKQHTPTNTTRELLSRYWENVRWNNLASVWICKKLIQDQCCGYILNVIKKN